ncbi:hypothetical protein IPL68_02365 [Candidatus Saccharibacteria bacterium]|nr:MAG: hypothetical protein IPL68_02365 [Candidatus Saccharibacteria bacterium]
MYANIEGQTAKFGNAVWSKYPITHAETVFSNGSYSPSQKTLGSTQTHEMLNSSPWISKTFRYN